jgi:type VI secretion system protein ImpK
VNKTVRLDPRQPVPVPGRSQPPPGPPMPPPPSPPMRQTMRGNATRIGGGIHPLAEPMYWACADLLTLASQLALGATPPSATELRNHLSRLFADMHARALAASVAPEDAIDAAYALMALFDEILVQARWPGRMEWQTAPLQFVHFHENIAGENFFRRVDVMMQQPHRAHVLLIYFLCLGMGFQGRYAVAGGAGLAQVYEQMGAAVGHALPPAEVLSPHGEPADAVKSLLRREAPIVRLALACFLAALVVFGVLRVVLSAQVGSAVAPMRDFTGSKP